MADYYAPPPGPPPRRPVPLVTWVIIGALAVAVAVLATLLATRDTGGSGGRVPRLGSTNVTGFDVPKKLSHTAVEQFITSRLNATNVVCNGGRDFALKADGAKFTCTAAGGKRFTITITDAESGHYVVS